MAPSETKIRIEYDDGKDPRRKDQDAFVTRRGRASGFYVFLPDGTEREIPIGYMRVSEMAALKSLFEEIRGSQEPIPVEAVLADLHSQEIAIGTHPEFYSPDQVRKTLTRFGAKRGSITVERSIHETITPGTEKSDQRSS